MPSKSFESQFRNSMSMQKLKVYDKMNSKEIIQFVKVTSIRLLT
jgi:hypothetical protein